MRPSLHSRGIVRSTLSLAASTLLPLTAIIALLAPLAPIPARADLASYLAQPDTTTKWQLVFERNLPTCTFYELRLQSQTWQNILWEHNLYLFVPKKKSPPGAALLMIEGGKQSTLNQKPNPAHLVYGAMLAEQVGVPVAILKQVPNQPLYGDLFEDPLIAKTFANYLETGDKTWPLLFPMTKAAVKAMDALGEFTEGKLPGGRLDNFVVTGASKRGWTTWLTGASDKRVTAIAPIVIDMLNTKAQIQHQRETLGKTSDSIGAYDALLDQKGERIDRLWKIIDPYTYRERYTLPKLIILGNNDPFWSTDALNLYWDGLPEPKWIHYVPNAGHNLAPEGKKAIQFPAISTLARFVSHHFCIPGGAASFPSLHWTKDRTAEGHPRITAETNTTVSAATLWVAHSETRDFRKSTWEAKPLAIPVGQKPQTTLVGSIPPPAHGYSAFYLTLTFGEGADMVLLSTQLHVEPVEPAAASSPSGEPTAAKK